MSAVLPRVSVILPAYHSDATLATCLEALRAQTFRDFEVIVVNSSAEEHTRRVVQRYPEVVFEQSPRRLLPHAARNAGVRLARGDLLVVTDPDCVPAPTWLERLVQAQAAGAVVQGSMALQGGGWVAQGAHLCKWYHLLPGLPPCSLETVATGNALYARAVWAAVGPFEEEFFAGDALLSWRAADHGFNLAFEPDAVVAQVHQHGLASLARERFARGREYGRVRAGYQAWSRPRTGVYLLALPLLPLIMLARAARACRRAGWLGVYLRTLPVGVVGQVAWCLGEALGHVGHLVAPRRAPDATQPAVARP